MEVASLEQITSGKLILQQEKLGFSFLKISTIFLFKKGRISKISFFEKRHSRKNYSFHVQVKTAKSLFYK
jgi:hypothetical protein